MWYYLSRLESLVTSQAESEKSSPQSLVNSDCRAKGFNCYFFSIAYNNFSKCWIRYAISNIYILNWLVLSSLAIYEIKFLSFFKFKGTYLFMESNFIFLKFAKIHAIAMHYSKHPTVINPELLASLIESAHCGMKP